MTKEKEMTGYPSIDKPWLKYYSKEAISTKLPECTMYEHIYNCNHDNLDAVAINYYDRKFTYRIMFDQISRIAGRLDSVGIREGDVVTICMINSPEAIFLLFALNKIGAVANMIYGGSSEKELEKYISETSSSFVFTLDIFQDKFVKIAGKVGLKQVIVVGITESMSLTNRLGARVLKKMKPISLSDDPRFVSWKQFFRQAAETKKMCHNGDAPAIITYTGGTTGGSKGAMLSNKAILAVAQQYIIGETSLCRQSTWAQLVPLFTAYGVTCSLMIPLIVGMTLIVRISMTDSIAELCKKFAPNHIIYGPPSWEAFADEDVNMDLSNLATPITGGDELRMAAEEKIDNYLARQGCLSPLLNGYGMTEVGAAVSVNFRFAHKFGSVGIPFVKDVISAFDLETGQELIYGEKGEICIQAPSMMLGYINNPAETANIIKKHEDGSLWVHSGDFGYVSEEGYVYICGRLKRYFMYRNERQWKKVFSLDIERMLLKHSKVDNCAVVPVSDPVYFQVSVAYIILKEKNQKEKDIEQELINHGAENLADGYRPIRYVFVEKFPLTKVGKVDYLELEKMAKNMSTK